MLDAAVDGSGGASEAPAAVDQVQVWTKDLADQPEGRAASAAVLGAWTQHDGALLSAFVATGEERYDEPTLDASRISSRAATMPASELRRLTRDVQRLIQERVAGAARAAPDQAAPTHRIQIQFNAFPID